MALIIVTKPEYLHSIDHAQLVGIRITDRTWQCTHNGRLAYVLSHTLKAKHTFHWIGWLFVLKVSSKTELKPSNNPLCTLNRGRLIYMCTNSLFSYLEVLVSISSSTVLHTQPFYLYWPLLIVPHMHGKGYDPPFNAHYDNQHPWP